MKNLIILSLAILSLISCSAQKSFIQLTTEKEGEVFLCRYWDIETNKGNGIGQFRFKSTEIYVIVSSNSNFQEDVRLKIIGSDKKTYHHEFHTIDPYQYISYNLGIANLPVGNYEAIVSINNNRTIKRSFRIYHNPSKINYEKTNFDEGVKYLGEKKYHKAISMFTKAISSNESLKYSYYNRHKCYLHTKKYSLAIRDLARARELGFSVSDKEVSDIYHSRGKENEKEKNLHAALSDYNKAIELNQNNLNAHIRRGLTYYKIGDYKNALIDFRIIYSKFPKPGFKENIGLACFGLQRYDEAIKICEKALSQKPDLDWSMLILAMSYERKGDMQKAFKYYEVYLTNNSAEKFNKEFFNINIRKKLLNLQDRISMTQKIQKVAVLTLDATGLTKEECFVLTDRLNYELISLGNAKIIDRRKMNEILNEQKIQLTGITTDKDIIRVGEILNVQKIISGSVGKIGSFYSIQLKIISVETGEIIAMIVEDIEGSMGTVIKTGIKNAAEKLSKSLTN